MSARAGFTRMQDSTADDWSLIKADFMPYQAAVQEQQA